MRFMINCSNYHQVGPMMGFCIFAAWDRGTWSHHSILFTYISFCTAHLDTCQSARPSYIQIWASKPCHNLWHFNHSFFFFSLSILWWLKLRYKTGPCKTTRVSTLCPGIDLWLVPLSYADGFLFYVYAEISLPSCAPVVGRILVLMLLVGSLLMCSCHPIHY